MQWGHDTRRAQWLDGEGTLGCLLARPHLLFHSLSWRIWGLPPCAMSCEEKLALGPCSSTRESDTKLHSQLVSKPQVVRAEWGREGWLWLQVCVGEEAPAGYLKEDFLSRWSETRVVGTVASISQK